MWCDRKAKKFSDQFNDIAYDQTIIEKEDEVVSLVTGQREGHCVSTYHNVVPVDGDVGVPVGSVHLVHEAEGVKKLMDHNLDNDNNDI